MGWPHGRHPHVLSRDPLRACDYDKFRLISVSEWLKFTAWEKTDLDAEIVMDVLGRIEHGVFA
jgi:hypothetical protein